jgi:hypothetical protein
MPPEAINRLADNWRPLFAIAQVVGGHWPQRLLEAFQQLQAASSQPVALVNRPPSLAEQLLADVRQVFAAAGADRLFSSYIVRALRALPNRPWSGSHAKAKPITETRLARLLSSLGVISQPLRIGADTARGYLRSDILPPAAANPAPDFEI